MKRRIPPAVGEYAIVPALPATSTMLNKLPLVREHLTATQYEDKSPRVPGYLTVRNRGASFEITLYDPDSGTRLVASGTELDKTLLLLETLLGVEDQAWELDRYLTEQLAARNKKKKK